MRQNRQEGLFLGAWANGSPVGHVFLKWNPNLPTGYAARVLGAFGDLENMFAVESWRSRGIASAIINEAEHLAWGQGWRIDF
jgi:GNAT superfamily N-acetyltransferase